MISALTRHVPVLVNEVVAALAPQSGEIFVDGTFGRGGYTRHILTSATCTVYGIDRDPAAVAVGQALMQDLPERFVMLHGTFSNMIDLLSPYSVKTVDGIALDLGVSSPQFEQAERGFSFQNDGPLDMRMSSQGPTAADLVNGLPEAELADVLFAYGEERKSRRIAKAIITRRADQRFERTGDLARVVAQAVSGFRKIHPATKTFQALRIAVNQELDELTSVLDTAERILKPAGRLAVVTFHSLEDRIVKHFLQDRSNARPRASRHIPVATNDIKPTFQLVFRGAKVPTEQEVEGNRRARSAKLRAARRTDAPIANKTTTMGPTAEGLVTNGGVS